MYRPNRIGPWPIGDIETPPWTPGATLLGVIDDVTPPLIGAGVRSVTAPLTTNYESFFFNGVAMTSTGITGVAFGLLISGTNPEPDNNIVYAISGTAMFSNSTGERRQNIFPLISKLDATPSDPDALITLTDYVPIPMAHYSIDAAYKTHNASVNTQVVLGDFRG